MSKKKSDPAEAPEGAVLPATERPRVTYQTGHGGSVVVDADPLNKLFGKVHYPFPKTTQAESTEEHPDAG